jgi:hypothetical protein
MSVCASLLFAASANNLPSFCLPVALILAVPIAVGYGTKTVTVLSICLTLYLCVLGHGLTPSNSPQIVTALALICAGPGAFSVDAYAFGRSTIVMGGRSNVNEMRDEITTREDPPDWGGWL